MLDYILGFGSTIPEPVAAHYLVQLLAAVTAMHDRNVCHRDLKPENCVINLPTHTLKVQYFLVN